MNKRIVRVPEDSIGDVYSYCMIEYHTDITEKIKEIKHNRKQFVLWIDKQLEKFDDAENNINDYFDFSDDCVPFDIKEHGINYINKY